MDKQITNEVKEYRQSSFEIDPLFLNRWSPRSFTDRPVEHELLYSLFEAAHWAPSGSNEQPWRFILVRSQEDRERFFPCIADGNRIWCEKAPVLVVVLSKKTNSKGDPNPSHAFDTGTAWGYLALQAAQKGLITHAMGGFDREQTKVALKVPEEYEPHAVVAIGYRGEKEALPEHLQEREQPSTRLPLADLLFEGQFDKRAL